MSGIAENILRVRAEIDEAVRAAGRKSGEVRLVAVSKTKPIEMVEEAFRSGQLVFGENYVQEAVEKIAKLPKAEWHLIGSLQSNKVKQIVGKVALIQTVDREKLAREIDKVAAAAGIRQDVLLQVHIGDEDTKSGVSLEELPHLFEVASAMEHLHVRGLMAMPPLLDDEMQSRKNFAALFKAKESLQNQLTSLERKQAFSELSMGTSADFAWAIREGATLVRVGTSIFGSR